MFTDIAGRFFFKLPLTVAAILLGLLVIAAQVLAWQRRAFGRPLMVVAAMVIGGVAVTSLAAITLDLLRPGDFWRAYPLVAYLALYALLILVMGALIARLVADRARATARSLVADCHRPRRCTEPRAARREHFLPDRPSDCPCWNRARSARSAHSAAARRSRSDRPVPDVRGAARPDRDAADRRSAVGNTTSRRARYPAGACELDAARLRPALGVAGLAALGLSAAALAVPRASAERPLGTSIDYYREANFGTANWAIATKQAPLPAHFPEAGARALALQRTNALGVPAP